MSSCVLIIYQRDSLLQEGRELPEEVPDDAGLPDAVHRHHLLLLGHLLQGPTEQEERPAAHEVSCCC